MKSKSLLRFASWSPIAFFCFFAVSLVLHYNGGQDFLLWKDHFLLCIIGVSNALVEILQVQLGIHYARIDREKSFEVVCLGDLRIYRIMNHVRPKVSECKVVRFPLQLFKHFEYLLQRFTPRIILPKIQPNQSQLIVMIKPEFTACSLIKVVCSHE